MGVMMGVWYTLFLVTLSVLSSEVTLVEVLCSHGDSTSCTPYNITVAVTPGDTSGLVETIPLMPHKKPQTTTTTTQHPQDVHHVDHFPWTLVRICPYKCRCAKSGSYFLTNCSFAGLLDVPSNIYNGTTHLNLSYNHLREIPAESLDHLHLLLAYDIRGNSNIEYIPLLYNAANLTRVHTDSGFLCCIYETDWDRAAGKDARSKAEDECEATTPYTECHDNLLEVFSLVLYTICVPLSLVLNPWIITLTMGFRPRRKDAILHNNFHFSCCNLLVTIYGGVILGYGYAYHRNYPYHMESWLNNDGCSVIGYMLIAATLAEQFFWMIEVICIYQKLRYPLHPQRHVKVRHLTLNALCTWGLACLIAAVPFMSHGNYNRVGLCLPFYSDDEFFGFKFTILYTVFMAISLTVNLTLAILLLRSFIRHRKQQGDHVPEVIAEENKAVERMILYMIIAYLILDIIVIIFLILSCLDGQVGKTAREWFARICILSAVVEPLVGPIRKKSFYSDTIRLLQKWNCYKWDRRKSTKRSIYHTETIGDTANESTV